MARKFIEISGTTKKNKGNDHTDDILMKQARCKLIFYLSLSIFTKFLQIILSLVLIDCENQENVPTWEELIGDNILIEFNLQFDVNFSSGKNAQHFVKLFLKFFILFIRNL